MKRTFIHLAAVCSALAFCTSALAMEVAAKATGATLVSKPANTAEKVGTLAKGERIAVENRVGMYWSAEWKGKKVFVKVNETEAVSSNANKGLIYKSDDNAKAGRQRATAVMGIRGLDVKEDLTAGSGKGAPELMRKMEKREVDAKAVSEIEKAVNAELEAKTSAAPVN